jgi:hypothetical protein
MQTTERDTLIQRIKKLQNLTVERGATPEEAAAAAAKIQAILFQYNLEQIDIDQADPLHAPDPLGKVEFTHDATRTTITWRRSLLHHVAKNNGCHTVYIGGTTKQAIIGTRAHIEGVLYLFDVIARQIDELATAAAKAVLSNKTSYRNSFCLGAVNTIGARLREQRQADEARATAPMSTAYQAKPERYALALRNQAIAVQDATKKFFPHVMQTRYSIGNPNGYAAGKAAGHNVRMHQGVAGRPTSGLIG